MIDIGLTKLALIGVVALVVVGPERLPKVARMAGSLFGRAQRYINEVKSEVSREIEIEELRKMHKDVQDAANNVERDLYGNINDIGKSVTSTDSSYTSPSWDIPRSTPTADGYRLKAKKFRKKKIARTAAVPLWYKNQHGRKAHVMSAAARVARYRPITAPKSAGFF